MLDIVIILVMALPMLLFSVFPGIKIGDYLEKKYNINESTKRKATVFTTILFTIMLSSFVHFAKF